MVLASINPISCGETSLQAVCIQCKTFDVTSSRLWTVCRTIFYASTRFNIFLEDSTNNVHILYTASISSPDVIHPFACAIEKLYIASMCSALYSAISPVDILTLHWTWKIDGDIYFLCKVCGSPSGWPLRAAYRAEKLCDILFCTAGRFNCSGPLRPEYGAQNAGVDFHYFSIELMSASTF